MNSTAALSGSMRKPYVSPQLTLFGQVAALTQGTNCSAENDGNAGCAAGTMDMGMN